uniref:Uncharacterized protein n=1 Tax=viral metagenome TaxID=1070528 RepID=A0A6C0DSX5_9ZZZZ
MNIVKTLDQYDENCIYFCDPIKNNVMNEGNFIRILYSTPTFVLNGVYLLIRLNDIIVEKYYNKYKCIFNVNNHKDVIEGVKTIEDNLLKKINVKNKFAQNKIYDQLKNGNIKIFSDVNPKTYMNTFLLKISGIWETETQYGVTYKFSKINHP